MNAHAIQHHETTTGRAPLLKDWMSKEKNFWAFRHVRQIIPTAPIKALNPTPLPASPVDNLSDVVVQTREASEPLEEHLKTNYTDSIVALRKGRVAFEWYAPGVSGSEPHINFSVSKSLTGLLAGILADKGLFDFKARVVDYVPEVQGSAFDASVQNLFDMALSLNFSEDYLMNDPMMLAYRQATGWVPGSGSEGLHQFLQRVQPNAPEGEKFQYASPTTDMAGWVLERAGKAPLTELLSTYLWGPVGAETDGDLTLDAYGAGRAAGGVSCTTRDLAKVGQLICDGGRDVVSQSFIDDLFAGERKRWAEGGHVSDFPDGAYRNFWYDIEAGSGVLYAIGIHGQGLYIDTKRDVVVAKHSSWPVALSDELHTHSLAGLRTLADQLAG